MVGLIREALGEALLGIYIDGSLATGAFAAEVSDIDLIAVTSLQPVDADINALSMAVDGYRATRAHWSDEIELTVAPREALSSFDPLRPSQCWVLERGWTEHLKPWLPDPGWLVHLDTLRRHGIALYGPEAGSLVKEVSAGDLRGAMAWGTGQWLTGYLDSPQKLENPGTRRFAALTCCRILYTFETGQVASKPAAGEWALSHLPGRWRPVIEASLKWRTDTTIDFSVEDAMELMRFTQRALTDARST